VPHAGDDVMDLSESDQQHSRPLLHDSQQQQQSRRHSNNDDVDDELEQRRATNGRTESSTQQRINGLTGSTAAAAGHDAAETDMITDNMQTDTKVLMKTSNKLDQDGEDVTRAAAAEAELDDVDDECCGRCGRCRSGCLSDCYFPRRYTVVLLLFVGLCVVHAQRVNVGVAVVSILDARHDQTLAAQTSAATSVTSNSRTTRTLSEMNWDNHMIGWLHAVFYVGLLVSQVPCGYIVTKYPSHRLFGGCLLMTHSLNFLLPLSIESDVYAMACTVRLAQGLVEGLLYPSCYDVMRHWTMPEERSRTGATVLTGAYIGPTLGMIASGLLTHYAGWQYVFYFHGALGVLLFFIWLALVHERPSTHPHISLDECKTIESKQGDAALIYEHDTVPWKSIFTSPPVYALIVCNFARSFVFYMLLTNQPTFLNVFKFTLAEVLVCRPFSFTHWRWWSTEVKLSSV
jgi:MFS family permease